MGRKLRKRKNGRWFFLFFIIVLLGVLLLPALRHISALGEAEQSYNLAAVEQELNWFKKFGQWVDNIPAVKDGELWYALNSGQTEGMESQLEAYQSDKYRLWLFQLQLQSGDLDKSTTTMQTMKGNSYRDLAQSMLLLAQGDGGQAGKVLTTNPSGLNKHEQALWMLCRAQSFLQQGDWKSAAGAVEEGEKLEPLNPNLQLLKFRLAVVQGDFSAARQLLDRLDQYGQMKNNSEFLVQQGLLFLADKQEEDYNSVIEKLKPLSSGNAYVAYLAGVKYLSEEEWTKGKESLNDALADGLKGALAADAKLAVEQTEQRLQAEPLINKITNQ